ncbi:AAA family ATPase [Actinoplanes sp. NPDC049681]|uniref:AAA family ATPase n=1 Tax=Actinoplanes sp. NPDC049681 TaxID=3363905 RepID=UPI00378C4354
MSKRLRIRSIEIHTTSTSRRFTFDRPLTALIGPVGSGKSSLLMLIKHATGGRAALTPAVRRHVTRVVLDMQIDDTRLTLARNIPDPGGNIELVDPTTHDTEETLPVRSRDGAETISDRLLHLLGIPHERIPTRRRGATSDTVAITFQNLMAYLYVEAVDIDRSIAGHTETYTDRARRALFEFMFGLNDAELVALQRREGQLNTDITNYKAEVAAVGAFLEQTQTPEQDGIDEDRRNTLVRLTELRTALDNITSQSAATGATADTLYADIDRAATEERNLHLEAARRADTVIARQAVLAQLELDHLRAQQSNVAARILGTLEFAVCPRCLQDLDHRPIPEDHCRVCLQPDPPGLAATEVDDETRNRLQIQIDETRALLAADRTAAERAADLARTARLHLSAVRQRVDAITRDRAAPLLNQTAELSARHATLLARLGRLDEMTNARERFADRERRLRTAEAERKTVRADIKQRKQAMSDAHARVGKFNEAFKREITMIGVPGVQEAFVSTDDYLPRVNGSVFHEMQASGGGIATAVHVAYSLALITVALDDNEILVPSFLMIDSPQNAIGQSPSDVELSQHIYERLINITDAAGSRIQLIIADNSLPAPSNRANWNSIHTISFGYGNDAMIPGVWHAGPSAATRRVEDSADDE